MSASSRPDCTATLELPFRPPPDWSALLRFIAGRAIPGVEAVQVGQPDRTGKSDRDHRTGRVALPPIHPRPPTLICRRPRRPANGSRRFRASRGPSQPARYRSTDPHADVATLRAVPPALPGVGPWTVEYVAMRAWRDADAWPARDPVLTRAIAARDPALASLAQQRLCSDAWRPWRACAAMHLWNDVPCHACAARGG